MMNIEKIQTLEKLDLTREEALEWLDMLAQKEHKSWTDVVANHSAINIKTNCIICYKDKKGVFSYHKHVDTSRIKEIYGIQFSPDWMMSVKDEENGIYHRFGEVEAKELCKNLSDSGWSIARQECFKEYHTHYKYFLQSEDRALLSKLGVTICGMHTFHDYWSWNGLEDTSFLSPIVPHDMRYREANSGYIRLFRPVKDLTVND